MLIDEGCIQSGHLGSRREAVEGQIPEMKANAMKKLEYCQIKLLPTEDAKQSDITQMRFQQFKQREEEAKRTKEK